MKINKIFLMSGIAALSLMASSCSDDDDDYEVGPQAGSQNVGFYQQTNQVLALTATDFEIQLKREGTNGDLTVPLELVEASPVITAPTSATFANGDSIATVKVGISADAEAFVNYKLTMRVPSEYTNPYKEQDFYTMLNVTVMKEDYKPWGVITYDHHFFDDWTFDVPVEHSEYLDLYRMDIFDDGYTFYMKIDDEDGSITICDSNGNKYTGATQAGFTYSDYGMVSATWVSSAFTGWDDEDQAYYIPWKWTVSAGSFGSDYDWFVIKEKY